MKSRRNKLYLSDDELSFAIEAITKSLSRYNTMIIKYDGILNVEDFKRDLTSICALANKLDAEYEFRKEKIIKE